MNARGNAITTDVSSYFSDPDGDALTYTATSSYTRVATVRVSGATLTITPVAEAGTTTITVTASDSGGLSATQTFAVTANEDLNRAPVIVSFIPAQTLNVDGNAATVDLSSYFSDPDGDTLSYKASSSPTGVVTVNVSGTTLTITPVAVGTATVNVIANDGHSNANLPFSVTVNGQSNRAPVAVGSIPSQTVNAAGNTSVGVDSYFSDPDGDALTYTATSSDTGVATASTSSTTVTAIAVAVGTATITVTASDPDGLTATQTFSVTVSGQSTATNRAPVAVGTIRIPPLYVGSGLVRVVIGADSYFSDPDGDTLTYTATSSDTSVVTFQWFDTSLSIESVGGGAATITITASDGELTATQSVFVTVTGQSDGKNRAPVARVIPPQKVAVSGSATINLGSYFSDPDGDILTYAANSANTGVATASASGATATIIPVAVGTTTIFVIAADTGGLTASQTFSVTVYEQSNRAPVAVGTIPGQTVIVVGNTTTIDVSSYFSDPDGDTLSYAFTPSDASKVNLGVAGSTVTIAPVAVGAITMETVATDPGGLTATQTFSVTVNTQSNPTNRAPVAVGTIGIPPLYVGRDLVRVVIGADSYFSDPDGDTLTYTASSSDTGVATFQWFDTSLSIESVGAGTATITVTASDGSLTGTQSVFVTVNTPSNRAPDVVGTIPSQTVTVGGTTTINLANYFSDPDGDTLTYTASSSDTTKATVSVSEATLTITPAGISLVAEGTATITVTASDPGGLTATQTFAVSVALPNRAPVAIGTIPSQTVTVGETTTVNLGNYFSDPDGEMLSYTGTSSDTTKATVSVSGATLTITPAALKSKGTATITVTASDAGGLTATQTFTVNVVLPNRAPDVVGTIPSQTVTVGETTTVNLGNYFSDPDGEMLSYTGTSSDTTKVTVSVSGATLTITPAALKSKGTTTITVTASDAGGLTATQTFTVNVVLPNRAPVAIGTIPGQTVNLGGVATVNLGNYFSDPDSDTLAYTASSSDTTRATVSVSGATLTITPVALTSEAPEPTTITVTASDAEGLTATQAFSAIVVKGDVNDDGIINILDLVLVASHLGESGTINADLNGDGVINVQDLILAANVFGGVLSAPAADGTLTVAQVRYWLDLAEQELSRLTHASVAARESAYNRGLQVLKQMVRKWIPQTTALLPNYPNPFNPETWIPYHLANASHVQISIYDASGHFVRILTLGHQAEGYYTSKSRAAYWDGRDSLGQTVGSGIYFYQLQAGSESFALKMVVLK